MDSVDLFVIVGRHRLVFTSAQLDFIQLEVEIGQRKQAGHDEPNHNKRFIMPSLPDAIVPLLSPFASLFDARTWRKV